MRKYIDIFLLGLVVVAGSYLVYTHPAQAKHILLVIEGRSAPCASVVTYSIGTIDPRFGISKETLLSDIATAAMIWEDTSKKTLFRYQESGGDVTINLTYDRRQAATDKLTSIDTQSTQGKASYDALKARYDVLYTSIQREQADVTSQGRSYKQDEASFNQSVALWNSRGGAPPSVYTQLQTQKEALAQQYRDLTVSENTLTVDIQTLNSLATSLNGLITTLNLHVAQYNAIGASLGEFEEGLYQVDGGIQTIAIYEYSSHVQLVRVLAHEMGHALGLEHVDDPQAIMYKLNTSKSLAATSADTAELKRVCAANI